VPTCRYTVYAYLALHNVLERRLWDRTQPPGVCLRSPCCVSICDCHVRVGLVVGSPPFKAASEYLTFQKVTDRDISYPPDFPPEAQDLVDRLLAMEPEQRLGAYVHRSSTRCVCVCGSRGGGGRRARCGWFGVGRGWPHTPGPRLNISNHLRPCE
jgi:hypothetical protein